MKLLQIGNFVIIFFYLHKIIDANDDNSIESRDVGTQYKFIKTLLFTKYFYFNFSCVYFYKTFCIEFFKYLKLLKLIISSF